MESLVAEVLDDGLELVVSEQIDGISGGVESLLEVGFEGVDDEADLEVGVGGEHFGGVDSSQLK